MRPAASAPPLGSVHALLSAAKDVQQKRAMKTWTTADLAVLREHAHLGAEEVARLLDVSVSCVRSAAHRHRISLRRHGERRGSVLGQPRGVSLPRAVRDDLASGRVDAQLLADRMAAAAEAEICPCCGHRPVRVRSSGYCVPCHRETLIAHHVELLDEIDAQRALWVSRQNLKRARDRREDEAP